MNEYHRVNFMEAQAAVRAIPSTQFSLNQVRGVGPCGPVVNIAGMLPRLPHFARLGVIADPKTGAAVMPGADATMLSAERTLAHLFGPFARDGHALFAPAGKGAWDQELCQGFDMPPTDKDLALRRLNHVLALVVEDLRKSAPQRGKARRRTRGAAELAA